MSLSDRKKKWLNACIDQLHSRGYSKAVVARELGILPQSLNNILNGNRGISDAFIDALEKQYKISQFELTESIADRLSEIIIDFDVDNLEIIASDFGVTEKELANFTNNLEFPSNPLDFARFIRKYPEYNYKWILIGSSPKFNDEEKKCLKAIKLRVNQKNHPESSPNPTTLQTDEHAPDGQMWQLIAFQNEQLKAKDEQIRQLLDILQKQ